MVIICLIVILYHRIGSCERLEQRRRVEDDGELRLLRERLESGDEILTGGGFEDDLPGIAAASALVKGGERRRNLEVRILA